MNILFQYTENSIYFLAIYLAYENVTKYDTVFKCPMYFKIQ